MKYLKIITFTVVAYQCCKTVTANWSNTTKSHEKSQSEKWFDEFMGERSTFDYTDSIVNLIVMLTDYLDGCVPVVFYDSTVEDVLRDSLLKKLPVPFMHGEITNKTSARSKKMLNPFENKCVSYVLFMQDVMSCREVIGAQTVNKVIIVARSSQWRVYEFLESEIAQSFVNLLVITKSDKLAPPLEEMPFILYTHELYVDGLGSSTPQVLTSWKNGTLTRPGLNLFPRKMSKGFAGHRFIISLANQPPYVIKRDTDSGGEVKWEGMEVRLIKLLSQKYNFTIDFREAHNTEKLGVGKAVTNEVQNHKADIGIGGLYVVAERIDKVDVSYGHSQDCAAFISLTSTALPRWRAIMGPFQWSVWLALTLTYLFAIFPLAYSDRHSLKYLIETPEEAENMFWYVFGTFTNCFSFTGKKSWSKSEKISTRLLIGFYWIFTIIITACYTGSIIAFVTIPVFPETADTVKQLLAGHYQIGTLDKGGWEYWFENSSDPYATKLLKRVDYVPTLADGIKNVTSAFFWSYAFLGSRAELDYVVRTNFSTTSKRAVLHISSECFVPFGVALNFPMNAVYTQVLNQGIIRTVESGFLKQIHRDVQWEMMRSATGKLLQANSGGKLHIFEEDRALALDDTQGMFLLLGFGYLLGGISLISELLGGCFNLCKRKIRLWRSTSAQSIASNPRSYNILTPRQKLDSIQYGRSNIRLNSFEGEHENHLPHQVLVSSMNDTKYKSIDDQINEIFNVAEIFGEEELYNDVEEELREEKIIKSRNNSNVSNNP